MKRVTASLWCAGTMAQSQGRHPTYVLEQEELYVHA